MPTSIVLQVAKLFGRFAEPKLYLDKTVGACCHSACSDCEWRLPDGGYRWDVMKSTSEHLSLHSTRACTTPRPAAPAGHGSQMACASAVPKWLPCYLARDFLIDGGGTHVPTWVQAIFPDGEGTAISRAEFDERVCSLAYETAMGPKGTLKPETADPSEEVLEALWEFLADGSNELEAAAAVRRLQDMSLEEDRDGAIGEGPDSLSWKEFAKGLGSKPFERF